MKVLWVKAGGLVPPDTGGKIRSYSILRELARQHSVTFFSFYAAHDMRKGGHFRCKRGTPGHAPRSTDMAAHEGHHFVRGSYDEFMIPRLLHDLREQRISNIRVFSICADLGPQKRSRPRRLGWAFSRRRDFGVDPLIDRRGQPIRWVGRLKPRG
jgi:hypothetical protein